MNRFDTDNLNTNATRALAEQTPELQAAVDFAAAQIRAKAETMTVPDLKAAIEANHNKKTKADLVEVYVKQETRKTDEFERLNTLKYEAVIDEWVAEALNSMMDAADTARVKLKDITEVHLTSQMDAVEKSVVAQHLGAIAADVLTAYANGKDLREATQRQMIRQLQIIVQSVRYTSHSRQQVLAADRFRQELSWRLRDFSISFGDLAN